VASGYWNQPDATEATFQARLRDSQEGPFLRTGDLGYIRAGELFVTGRLTDLITIDGRSYYPQAIETTAEQSHASILKPNCCAAFTVTVAGQVCLGIVAEIERRYWNRRSPNEAKSRLSRRRQPDRRRSSQLDAEPDLRQPFDPEEAIAAIRLAVSDQYQLPVYTVLLLKPGSVPKTPNGKVERYLCRELFLERKFKPIVASTLQLS
jgi:acyl-CoA synthetase (AMP-forming)/AMP-acid ligase II